MTTVHELAKQARRCFEFTGENHPTMRDNIWITRDDNKPDWLQEMIRDAGHHNADILPDDWCHEMVVNALDAIIDMNDDEEYLDDVLRDSAESHVDVYGGSLIEWLGSHSARAGYVDEAVEELGYPGDIYKAIQYGQIQEIQEIFQSVYQFLANLADGAEDNVDDSEGNEA